MEWMVADADRSRLQLGTTRPSLISRRRATKLVHERSDVTKAASALISPGPAPRNASMLELPSGAHLSEDQDAITALKAAIFSGAQDSPINLQRTNREVDERLRGEDVRIAIKTVSLQSAPGPSGLRFGYLQDALSDELGELR